MSQNNKLQGTADQILIGRRQLSISKEPQGSTYHGLTVLILGAPGLLRAETLQHYMS